MERDAFLEDLAEVFDVEKSELRDAFELSEDLWDSLTIIATIALIDEHFDVTVEGEEIQKLTLIGDFWIKIQDARVE